MFACISDEIALVLTQALTAAGERTGHGN